MRWTQSLIPTQREPPQDAESTSYNLLVRAGYIRKLSSGIYIYLPLGFRVLQNIINIVREEMNKAGAVELLMPIIQTSELWEKTGRFQEYGELMFKLRDRTGKWLLLGPTHEEIITYIAKNEIKSYKELPLNLYQIQMKFRDELRPRSGLIRAKEFCMKDAYSFHLDDDSLDKTFKAMFEAYSKIFSRCGLNFTTVEADTGLIGGSASYEFIAITDIGEDKIVMCTNCDYRANLEIACSLPHNTPTLAPGNLEEVYTPQKYTVEDVSNFLNVKPQDLVKTLIYTTSNDVIAVLIRGDYELNLSKLAKVLHTEDIKPATPEIISKVTGGPLGFSGPIGLRENIKIIVDDLLSNTLSCIVGANKKDYHLKNVNIPRDVIDKHKSNCVVCDVRLVSPGDLCKVCGGKLEFKCGIELGHLFKLGTKYSSALGATVHKDGRTIPMIMGCYGIGVSRILAAVVECNYDEKGIIWPESLSPYKVLITSIDMNKEKVVTKSKEIYEQLRQNGIEVLWDDRDISAGVKFNDADLLGIPYIIIIGNKLLSKDLVDIKVRKTGAILETSPTLSDILLAITGNSRDRV